MTPLFLIALLLGQAPMVDERVFEEARLFVDRSVEAFVNPESSIALPPKSYWEDALEALDIVYTLEPSPSVAQKLTMFCSALTPALCPAIRGKPFCFAHRPLPSMIMARCFGKLPLLLLNAFILTI